MGVRGRGRNPCISYLAIIILAVIWLQKQPNPSRRGRVTCLRRDSLITVGRGRGHRRQPHVFFEMTSLSTRSWAFKLSRVNFSLVLLRAFSADWPPRWRRGRGHDDTRTGPYPDPLANRAGGSHPDKRDQNSPPASPPLAPLLHPRHARKEDGPRRHRLSRTTNRRALEARRSPRRKRSAQSVGSAEPATQQSKSLLTPWQAAPRPQIWADQVVIVGTQRLALLPTPRQLVLVPVRLAWQSAPWWLPEALAPCLGSRIYPRSLLWEPPSRLHV
jgi:hypothetical protein